LLRVLCRFLASLAVNAFTPAAVPSALHASFHWDI
jgi:hypothetical protein